MERNSYTFYAGVFDMRLSDARCLFLAFYWVLCGISLRSASKNSIAVPKFSFTEYLTLPAHQVGKFVNNVFVFCLRCIYSNFGVLFSPEFINGKVAKSRVSTIFVVPTLQPRKDSTSEFFGTNQAKTIYSHSLKLVYFIVY